MVDVFDVLRRDHDEVRLLLDELTGGMSAGTGATEQQLRRRAELVERLIVAESGHEALEEEHFWPAVRDLAPDGARLAAEAVEQEQAAKQVLAALDGRDPSDAEFEDLLARFVQDGREHISYEESQVWPALRVVIGSEQANELADKIERGRSGAPTRPHPHAPPKPGVLKTAGKVAAATDRMRDSMSGRGRH